jgi:predicted GNAT family acetyltransferase
MKNYPEPITISGKTDLVEKYEQFSGLNFGKKQNMFFAECRSADYLGSSDIEIKRAGLEDVDKILALRKTIDEFHIRENARDILIKSMESKVARTYFTEAEGEITSAVSTTAENSCSAMIVGVCTRRENRKEGLATAIMQKLFKDVLDEGKTLCLFYDNPEAGSIYKRLGFKDIGTWTMFK